MESIDLTKTADDIKAQASFDAMGNLRIGYSGLTETEMESLKVLNDSPHWKVYKRILERAQAEYFRASTMVTDINGVVKMLHNSGLSAGINFSLMQLQVLCADYDARQKKALEKAEEKPQPLKRG